MIEQNWARLQTGWMTMGRQADDRATDRDYPGPRELHRQVELQVDRTPDRIAVADAGRVLTYRELDQHANRLAHRLRALGVGPDILCGVHLERSVDLVVALLAVLKAGGAYAPIDPGYPRDRIDYMLSDAQAPVVIASGELAAGLGTRATRVVDLERDRELIARLDSSRPDAAVVGESLAYVIYTSGSTGRPKGAMNRHSAIVNRLLWMQEAFGLGERDVVLQKTPFSFDVSVWEFFWPLMVGAKLYVARPGGHQDGSYLVETIVRERVTTMHFVPSMLAVFLEEEGVERCQSLTRVIVSGEALTHDLQERFFARLGSSELHNLYGPTECAVDVTHWSCERGAASKTVPIGRPIANTWLRILDPGFGPVPPGGEGELYIGGEGLGRGYFRRPELTAVTWVPDPLSTSGERLYRTGDLARLRDDGAIEFLGRRDHQMKIAGIRIEPGEVEDAIVSHADVSQAAVTTRREASGDVRLTAYLVSAPGVDVVGLRSLLRDHLIARLPKYLVPSAMVFLDRLPLSPSGKLDRGALPAPGAGDAIEFGAAGGPPQGAIENAVAKMWQELLNAGTPSRDDDFFLKGGNSLLATRMLARLREAFAVELTMAGFFANPRVRDTAVAIAELAPGRAEAIGRIVMELWESGAPEGAAARRSRVLARLGAEGLRPASRVAVPSREPGAKAPLSFGQERLWFLDRLVPNSAVYNIAPAMRLRGDLDPARLQRALDHLSERHTTLTAVFPELDGEPRIERGSPPRLTIEIVDLSSSASAEPEVDLERRAGAAASEPFDLVRGPLARVHLFGLSADDHVLLFVFHHIVADGWSIYVLAEELATLYADPDANLPSLAVDYGDYAAWQRGVVSGPALAGEIAHWRAALAGIPTAIELPSDRPRPVVASFRGAVLPCALDANSSAALLAVGRGVGATPYMTLMAAFLVLLSRLTGLDRLPLGTPIAGRQRVETEPLVGFFVNTLVVPGNLSGDPSFREVVKRVRDACIAAYAHQDLPYEKLIEALAPTRELGRMPWIQAVFALQNFEDSPVGREGAVRFAPWISPIARARLGPVAMVDTGTSKFDLFLSLVEVGDGISGWIEYSTDLFDQESIRRLLGQFQTLIRSAAQEPERPVSALELMSASERAVLFALNPAPRDYPRNASIHALFTAAVAKYQDRVAVVDGDREWTYAELDRRVETLARSLGERGVGPEVAVGIALPRSLDMVVAVLAINRAGGFYVPLDLAYPATRLKWMMAEVGAKWVVAESDAHLAIPAVTTIAVAAPSDRSLVDPPLAWPSGGGERLGYVMFTSGSTGRPKGVAVSERNIVRLVFAQDYARFGPGETWLQFAPLSFDASTLEIFGSLLHGARLVLAPAGRVAWADLAATIVAHRVSSLWLTASVFSTMVDEHPTAVAGVRQVLAGGDVVSPLHVARVFAQPGERRVVNGYGPTESTTFACCHAMASAPLLDRPIPIGSPLQHTRVVVLDAKLQPVPIGVSGELYIGGDGLARGYFGRPELTAERFVPDPFASTGARLYRTGDRARILIDGAIEFLGRLDQQVKLRGFRIEPGEIETVLGEHPRVQQVAVVVRSDRSGDRRLVGYVVASEGSVPSVDELRAFLLARLPDYMVPGILMFLDELPLNVNGKIDRAALPEPSFERPVLEAKFLAPQNEIESTIATVWREVLGLDRIGVADNFFDLGGHSLLLARAHVKLQAALGRELKLTDLFRFPTIASLAAWLAGGEGRSGAAQVAVAAARAAARDRAGRRRDALRGARRRGRDRGGRADTDEDGSGE